MKNLFTFAFIFSIPAIVQAASFDCAKAATPIEKLVCSSPSVSNLDEQLGQAYKDALEKATDKETLKQQQRTWLKEKRNACKDSTCLFDAYKNRLVELSNTSVRTNAKPKYKLVKGEQFQLCKDFLSLMNRVERKPYPNCGMDYEFDEIAKKQGFKAVSWVELDINNNKELLLNFFVYQTKEPEKEEILRRSKGFNEYSFPNKKINLWTAQFDLNLDGKKDTVYKVKYDNCGSTAGVYIDREDGQLDELAYARKVSGEPFFYQGRTYVQNGNGILEGFGSESYVSIRSLCESLLIK